MHHVVTPKRERERQTHKTQKGGGGGGGDLKIQFFSVFSVVFTKLVIIETRLGGVGGRNNLSPVLTLQTL